MLRKPPDILITTPESLYLMMTSRAREILTDVEALIVDEIHAVAPTKRGAHMALTLERLERHVAVEANEGEGREEPLQRIGLSATQRPLERIAQLPRRPAAASARSSTPGSARRWTSRSSSRSRTWRTRDRIASAADATATASRSCPDPRRPTSRCRETRRPSNSIWPAIYPELLKLVREHTSTIIFVNNRRGSERLAKRLNEMNAEQLFEAELAEEGEQASSEEQADAEGRPPGPPEAKPPVPLDRYPEIARAHHGSLAREERQVVEELLKSGQLPCLVATSSLELGIDMGAVDLVIQVESPKSVARGIQRIGRAGHELGAVSKGRIFPKFRSDLLECAVVAKRMRTGEIEETVIPRNPLDVLAQHIVSMVADEEWEVDEIERVVTAAEPYTELSREQLENVLDMLDGRYPSERFAELRPRLVWDRTAGTVRGRKGARQLAVTNAGHDPRPRALRRPPARRPPGRRARRGDGLRGARRPGLPARRLELADRGDHPRPRDRHPGPGRPGRGAVLARGGRRPAGRARPGDRRVLARGGQRRARRSWPRTTTSTSSPPRTSSPTCASSRRRRASCRATRRSSSSASATRSATGASACSPRSAVASTPPGGWRSPPGSATSSSSRRTRSGPTTGSSSTSPTPTRRPRPTWSCSTPTRSRTWSSASSPARRCSAPASARRPAASLLIPRAYPGKRTPLWQQRLKSQSLLEVAKDFPRFPITLETYREVLRDVLDLPALAEILRDLKSRRISLVEVETQTASPFASSLLFDYVATYMYEGDTPNAERRAAALALDRDLLRELLGQEELRELIDPAALADVEDSLQHRVEQARAVDRDQLQQILRRLGDLTTEECEERVAEGYSAESMLGKLEAERRIVRVRIAGEERWIAAEDGGLYRDALGVPVPSGPAGRVPRDGRGADGRADAALRAHPRPVPDRAGAPPLRRRPDGRR